MPMNHSFALLALIMLLDGTSGSRCNYKNTFLGSPCSKELLVSKGKRRRKAQKQSKKCSGKENVMAQLLLGIMKYLRNKLRFKTKIILKEEAQRQGRGDR